MSEAILGTEVARGEHGITLTLWGYSRTHKMATYWISDATAAEMAQELLDLSRTVEPCRDGQGNVVHDMLGDKCMRCGVVYDRCR